MLIGRILKKLRKSQKLTLIELSKKSGVQVATLSRIENEKMVGTLESHLSIAKALGIDLTKLYKESSDSQDSLEPIAVETQDARSDQFEHSEKSGYEIMTKKVLNKMMMPVLIRLDAGGETTVEQNALRSEKFIYILEGTIEITVDQKPYILEKGHTLYFNAALPHQMRNKGDRTARILCVGTPVTL